MSAARLGPWGPVSPSDLPRSPDRSYQAQLAAPWDVSSAWYLSGWSKGSSFRASPHASCCCLCRLWGLAPRTIRVATPDQVLCVSVCQSIWIFTSRAGDSFNFKSPAKQVQNISITELPRTAPAVQSFAWRGVVSQQSLPILCRNCSRRIVSLPVLNLAKYQYFWKL